MTPQAYLGAGLVRPESVIAYGDAHLVCSNARGGVSLVGVDGLTSHWIEKPDFTYERASGGPMRFVAGDTVNGLALIEGGALVAANIGRRHVETIAPDGVRRTLFSSVEGRALGLVNHVCVDHLARLWIAISSFKPAQAGSGAVAVSVDGGPLRLAAQGLHGANETRVDEAGETLFVSETSARRVSAFTIRRDHTLSAQRTFGPPDLGGFPDGISLDAEGGVWGVLIGRDIIFRIGVGGAFERVFSGGRQAWFDQNDPALAQGVIEPAEAAKHGFIAAPLFTSLSFFGPDRDRLAIGSLCGAVLPIFAPGVRGAPLHAWPTAAHQRASAAAV